MNAPLKKQHLIDPEICIRCNTCEETCPIDAVTHDDNNYVVDAAICNFCMDCIAPCPTGAIDNWRIVARPYTLDEQFSWDELPAQEEMPEGEAAGAAIEALEDEVGALLEEARKGLGGKAVAPASASKPTVNLYNRSKPARATVAGNFRLTDDARRERRPPHHPRFRRDAVPGARRPEHRHPAAGPRRQGRAARRSGCTRSRARATARSRTPTTSR